MAPPAPTPTTLPASAPTTTADQQRFEDADAGVVFQYPNDWKPVPDSKSQLKVAAPAGGQFTLDVPVLPFHIPGMIPVDQVEIGYVNDAKKRIADAQVTKLPEPMIPSSKDARVEIAGTADGKPAIDEAVLIVHQDKIFILAIDADDKSYPQMHAALDGILKSLQWSK